MLRHEGNVPSAWLPIMDATNWSVTKMTKFALALAAISALAVSQAQAQTVVTDTDGNGAYSMEELKAAFPDLTEEAFKAADVDADGALSADELKAAQDAGSIPA